MKIKKPTNYMVIGCGGLASYFLPPFLRTVNHSFSTKDLPDIMFVDGDKLEEKNMARQNFLFMALTHKVSVMQDMYKDIYNKKLKIRKTYFSEDEVLDPGTCVLCFADNHLARKHCLEAVDAAEDCVFIGAANSTISAQSYIYVSDWKDSPLDPRVRFPIILTDESESPLKIGDCNSEAVLSSVPQTPIANTMGASLALLMWNLWCVDVPEMDQKDVEDNLGMLPLEFFNTYSDMGRVKIGDL